MILETRDTRLFVRRQVGVGDAGCLRLLPHPPTSYMNGRGYLTLEVIWNIIHAMNKNYSRPETYYPRWLTDLLRQACQDQPIVVLSGARQTGKSTLLLNAKPFRDWRFLTMDDFDVLRQAQENPRELWAGTDRVVLDEVQRAPALMLAVKRAVDLNPGMRFVLSGSANLMLMSQVSESLAGRAVYLTLGPMTLGELRQAPLPSTLDQLLAGHFPPDGDASDVDVGDVPTWILHGLLPSLITLETPQSWTRWWEGYVSTYLERDLRQLSQIDRLPDFRRLMEILALRSGQVLNKSEAGRDAGISQPTVHRYTNLLETSYLFVQLSAYVGNRTARLVKAPKAFWLDPGLAAFLSGFYDVDSLRETRELGGFFETLILAHLRVLASLMTPRARIYFWRTRAGQEVDFVVEHGRRLLGIEVKRANRVGYGDAANLRVFLDQHPQAYGVILHRGQGVQRLGERIISIPWTLLVAGI